MIKFSVIFIIITVVVLILFRLWACTLSPIDQIRIAKGCLTKGETIFSGLVGGMVLLSIIFGGILAILWVLKTF